MASTTGGRLLLLSLCLLSPAAQDPPQDTADVFPDEAQGLVDRFASLVKEKRWPQLIQEYQKVMADPAQRRKVVQTKGAGGRPAWMSVAVYLNAVVAQLPPEALEELRVRDDNAARALYRAASGSGQTAGLEALIEAHFFSSVTDEATLELTTRLLEEGRVEDAAYYLERLLRVYPDPDRSIPRALVAARLIHALDLAGNRARLEKTAAWLAAEKIEGAVTVGGSLATPVELAAAALARPPRRIAAEAEPIPAALLHPTDPANLTDAVVKNDIRLRSYEFNESDEASGPGEAVKSSTEERATFVVHPFFPAYARYGDREIVVATNGTRVAALDPRSGRTYWVFDGRDSDSAVRAKQRQVERGNTQSGQGTPFMGVTIEGEYAYVTLASSAAGPIKRDSEQRGYQIEFPMAARIVCFRLADGGRLLPRERVWDTDRTYWEEHALQRQANEEPSNNWSFCSPPMPVGDAVYAGIVANPGFDSESYVVCLDRRTGRLRWRTYLCQVSGRFGNPQFGNTMFVMPLTLMTYGNGMVYASTNQGAVAALHPVNGSIQWISIYPRAGGEQVRHGHPGFVRVPSPPILHRGRLTVLPQDSKDLLAFDAVDGALLPVPKDAVKGDKGAAKGWDNFDRLCGLYGDLLILQANDKITDSHAVDPFGQTPAKSVFGARGIGSRAGAFTPNHIYLPIGDGAEARLSIYSGKSWKVVSSLPWRQPADSGNVTAAGPYVLSQSRTHLAIYTDLRIVRSWYAGKMAAEKPDLDALLAYGEMMHQNEQHEEAVVPFQLYLKASEGISAESKRRLDAQKRLGESHMSRGETAFKKDDFATGVVEFERSLNYSSDPVIVVKSSLMLARCYEKIGRPADAVRRLHSLRRDHGEREYVPDDGKDPGLTRRLRDEATARIQELLGVAGEAADALRKELEPAAEVLAQVAAADVEKLQEMLRSYPESRELAARMQEAIGALLKSDKVRDAERLLRDLSEIDPKAVGREVRRQFIEALERGRLHERALQEIKKLKELFGEEPTGGAPVVPEPVAAPKAADPAAKTLAKLASLKDPERRPPAGKQVLPAAGLVPLDVPAAEGQALLKAGSAVELWDLAKGERIWEAPHPGGWLGAPLELKPEGIRVAGIDALGPAAVAGLQAGDLIVAINGKSADTAVLRSEVGARAVGSVVTVKIKRGDAAEEEKKITLGARPGNVKPAVSAAFHSPDGALVVAWGDQVAALEPATGKLIWSWGLPVEGMQIEAAAGAAGRILVLARGLRDPERFDVDVPQRAPNQQVVPTSEFRLFALDDLGGRWCWTRTLDPAGAYALHGGATWSSVLLRSLPPVGAMGQVAAYQEDFSGFRRGGGEQPVPPSILSVVEAVSGRLVERPPKQINPYSGGTAMDAAARRLLWVDRNDHALKAVEPPLEAGVARSADRKLILDVKVYGLEGSVLCDLLTWKDKVVLVTRASTPKLWVFRVTEKGFEPDRELKLPEKFDLVRAHAGTARPSVDSAGVLRVYATERGRDPAGDVNATGYVFRWALEGTGSDPVGPPSYVPGLTQLPGRIEAGVSPFTIFIAPGARAAWGEGQDNRITIYDAQGGILKPEVGRVEMEQNVIQAWVLGGRLWFRREKQLHVYAPAAQEPEKRLDLGANPGTPPAIEQGTRPIRILRQTIRATDE